jgi:hypothetical protein
MDSTSPFAAAVPAQSQVGSPAVGATAQLPKRRNVVGVWLGLPLITLGVYSYIWYFKINQETTFNPRTRVNPAGAVLTLLFGGLLIIPPYISIYNTGKRIGDAQRAAGLPSTCSAGLGVLLCFVFSTWTLYYQSELNKIVDAYPGAPAESMVPLRGI